MSDATKPNFAENYDPETATDAERVAQAVLVLRNASRIQAENNVQRLDGKITTDQFASITLIVACTTLDELERVFQIKSAPPSAEADNIPNTPFDPFNGILS